MASAKIRLQAHVDSTTVSDTLLLSLLLELATAIGDVQTLTLASGNNTLTIPSGTKLIVFVPPVANATALLLKGANGDTGVNMVPNQWAAIPYQSGSVVINAAAQVSGNTVAYL